MSSLAAVLCYRDPRRAAKFYVENCGFRPVSGSGDLYRRGDARIRIVDMTAIAPTSPLGRRLGKSPGAGVALELSLDASERIEDLFVSLERSGADIVEPIGIWREGERSFTIADPGNYLIRFVEPSR